MNREVMKQLILESLSRKLGDGYSLSIHRVLKTNQTLDGLAILRKGENTAATIYLDSYYKELENITALESVTELGARYYDDYRELLKDVPHLPFLDDFAAVVYCLIGGSEGMNAGFLVHDSHMKCL